MINVSLTEPFKPCDLDRFSDLPGIRVRYEELFDADVILGTPAPDRICGLQKLKWVQSTSAGVDEYMKHKRLFFGRTLTTASGAFGRSISEYVLAMALALMKQLPLYRDDQKAERFADEGRQFSPYGKRLLVFGCGDIGCSAAKIFAPFGCHAVGVCRNPQVSREAFEKTVCLAEAEAFLPQADVIVCALPDTAETRGWFHYERLKRLKPEAILINVGRGSFIDTDALSRALSEGVLYGAALDVTDPEPLPPGHPLWQTPNCLITPHVSGRGFDHLTETTEKIIGICRENLLRYAEGRPLMNQVDLDLEYRRMEERR